VKITTLNVVMVSTGAILLYSGIKGFDPRDVIKWGLGGKKPEQMLGAKSDPMGNPQDNPDPGQQHPGDKGYTDPNLSPAGFPTLSV
jgi:hypothetical protein